MNPSLDKIGGVGIIGGGQLGCMLADAGNALGLSPQLYADPGSPACSLHPHVTIEGKVSDRSRLHEFFRQHSLISFENEFVDCDALERAAQGTQVQFVPELSVLRELQDKLKQKKLLQRLQLPSPKFLELPASLTPAEAVKQAFETFPAGLVLKWSRMGYDGKGVHLAQDGAPGLQAAEEFCQVSFARGVSVYAEQKVAFRRELAIIACQSITGEFASYPLVVSEQKNGICHRVLGPASALGISPQLAEKAKTYARTLSSALKLSGTFALELFEDEAGHLLVNEIAPRVHNSGHFTQDACPASQFENHLRAIVGMPLGETTTTPAFGMLNLLGPDELSLDLSPHPELPQPPSKNLRLHWYGKSGVRPRRKLGHVNGFADESSKIGFLKDEFTRYHDLWLASLRRSR